MTPKAKRMTALANLFKELPQSTQKAILDYKLRNTEIVYIPLSLIDMKKSNLHQGLWLEPQGISNSYRDYLEAKIIKPIGSQGYKLERSYIRSDTMRTEQEQITKIIQTLEDKLSVKQIVKLDMMKWHKQARTIASLKHNKLTCINCKHELTLNEVEQIVNELNKYKLDLSEAHSSLCYECLNEQAREI